jgi:hypothetical protein
MVEIHRDSLYASSTSLVFHAMTPASHNGWYDHEKHTRCKERTHVLLGLALTNTLTSHLIDLFARSHLKLSIPVHTPSTNSASKTVRTVKGHATCFTSILRRENCNTLLMRHNLVKRAPCVIMFLFLLLNVGRLHAMVIDSFSFGCSWILDR